MHGIPWRFKMVWWRGSQWHHPPIWMSKRSGDFFLSLLLFKMKGNLFISHARILFEWGASYADKTPVKSTSLTWLVCKSWHTLTPLFPPGHSWNFCFVFVIVYFVFLFCLPFLSTSAYSSTKNHILKQILLAPLLENMAQMSVLWCLPHWGMWLTTFCDSAFL